ncbi:alpha/beta fold hydrolase [Nitrincola sp.]|uniref:alpha/beta fold hydrolase n=1 Tax=Nitrincola sp. TaxID=1926584 RepID=UPI003A8E81DE
MIKRIVCLWILLLFSSGSGASDYDSTYVSVTVVGSGDDVILINGLASSPEVWAETVEQLQSSYRVHLFSIKGFAGTQAASSTPEVYLEALRDEVLNYIQVAQLDSPVLIGHSMGGLVSLMVGSASPDAVSKIIVVDALPFYSLLFNAEATSAQVTPFALGLEQLLLVMSPAQYEVHVRKAASIMVKSPERIETIIHWANTTDRAVYAQLVGEVMTYDGRVLLDRITAPIQVLYAYDQSMPITAEQLASLYQTTYSGAETVELIQVDDAYHFIMWDQPDAFHAHLESAL